MSSQRQLRNEVRAAHTDPINFTCGVCGKVHEFNPDYKCPDEVVTNEETPEVI